MFKRFLGLAVSVVFAYEMISVGYSAVLVGEPSPATAFCAAGFHGAQSCPSGRGALLAWLNRR